MASFILDAWAIMAWLKDQKPAADRVRALLDAAGRGEHKLTMNIINLGEVFYLAAKARSLVYAERVLEGLRPRILVVSASDQIVMAAADLKARHPISYADGFAAATAMLRQEPLVTGDPELRALAKKEKTLQLEWIGS
jgi:predicted nucleic acid-binding protein